MEQTALDKRRWGLDGFQIKMIALIIMTIDHIHYFGCTLYDLPLILTLIGRIAAPLFVFMVAEGFAHTHNRGKYLLRLYIGGTLMQFGNLLVNHFFPLPDGAIVMNGIFSTMALIVFYLLCIEKLREAVRTRNAGAGFLWVLGLIAPIAANIACFALFSIWLPGAQALLYLVPMPMMVEGGVIFVLMGIGLYYCRRSKAALAVFYTALLVILVLLSGVNAFNIQYAFFMWLALPFMLLYNGERGRGMKYLFYIYYPAHVYLFAIITSLLGR
ncbi:TraX family protein [Agathobaculum sp.]|uniref:TraX family protein n=1 Tax=Agathobaculum sp. TaxID=2048138 RepID=UPI002A8197FD|nr:TraX family protein [Agathobaculum sp.]MDY3617414.1 TraX family protein [Agathobaculum sp.]